jgi:opacity protein-like surface antigen
MKKGTFTWAAVLFVFCIATSEALAQNSTESYQTPPPNAPPPPGSYQPQSRGYYYDWPQGAGPYIRAGVGPSFWENGNLNTFGGPTASRIEFRPGLAANAAIGFAWNDFFATDFEVGFVGAKIRNNIAGFESDNSYIYNAPFLANAIISLPIPHSNIVPYVGIGGGGAEVVFDTENLDNGSDSVTGRDYDVVWAWQAFAGVRFRLNNQISLGVGYKYFATENSSFSYPPDNFKVGFDGARTHSVLFTVQINF